jgi:hypothetical protein
MNEEELDMESNESQPSAQKPRRTKRLVIVGGSVVIAAAAIGAYSATALAGGTAPPAINQPDSASTPIPPGPNVEVNSGPGPRFIETTSAGSPEEVNQVPSTIPDQGVLVNDNFELFPLSASTNASTKTALDTLTSQGAISAVANVISVSDSLGTTAQEASFTLPSSISAQGESTLHQLMDVPAWVVDYQIPTTQVTPAGSIGSKVSPNPITVSNFVAVVDSNGNVIFSTGTP